jgi:hypothetical protein
VATACIEPTEVTAEITAKARVAVEACEIGASERDEKPNN